MFVVVEGSQRGPAGDLVCGKGRVDAAVGVGPRLGDDPVADPQSRETVGLRERPEDGEVVELAQQLDTAGLLAVLAVGLVDNDERVSSSTSPRSVRISSGVHSVPVGLCGEVTWTIRSPSYEARTVSAVWAKSSAFESS